MSLLDLFCDVDDFMQCFEPVWAREQLANGAKHRQRATRLSASEIMTIMIHFHQSHYRDFKNYYTQHVQAYLRPEFPHLLSYGRLVQLMPRVLGSSVRIPDLSLRCVHGSELHRFDSHRSLP